MILFLYQVFLDVSNTLGDTYKWVAGRFVLFYEEIFYASFVC